MGASKQRIVNQHLSGIFFGLGIWVLLIGTVLGGSVLYWLPVILGVIGFGVRGCRGVAVGPLAPVPRLRRVSRRLCE